MLRTARILLLAACLLPLLALAGCREADDGRTPLLIGGLVELYQEPLVSGVAAFEREHPGVRVEVLYLSGEEILQRIRDGGRAPDVLALPCVLQAAFPYSEIWAFYREGLLSDLASFPRMGALIDSDEVIEDFWNAGTVGGAVVGVPTGGAEGWTVDEGLRQALGIELPAGGWAWDDVFALLEKGRRDLDGDGKKDTYFARFNTSDLALPPFLSGYAVSYWDDKEGRVDYDTEVFRRLMRSWKQAVRDDLVTADKNAAVVVTQGLFCTMQGRDETVFFPAPSFEAGKEGTHYAGAGLTAVCRLSEQPDLAAKFLAFLLDPDQNVGMYTMQGMFAPLMYDTASVAPYADPAFYNASTLAALGLDNPGAFAFYKSQLPRERPWLLSRGAAEALAGAVAGYMDGDGDLEALVAALG